MNKPKAIGTAAETAAVRALRQHGFPNAERRALAGTYDLGDIVGTPGIVWEVKGGAAAKTASDGQVEAWLDETETERVNARAAVGVLVMQRSGIGPANACRWWAVRRWEPGSISDHWYIPGSITVRTTLCQMTRWLYCEGYGDLVDPHGAPSLTSPT